MKHPQFDRDFIKDSGICWPYTRHFRYLSGVFRTDFEDILDRFQGCSRHVSLVLTMDIDD
jgi:hypothetical protein